MRSVINKLKNNDNIFETLLKKIMGVSVSFEREGGKRCVKRAGKNDDKKKLQCHYKSIMSAVKRTNNQFSCRRNQLKWTSSVDVIYRTTSRHDSSLATQFPLYFRAFFCTFFFIHLVFFLFFFFFQSECFVIKSVARRTTLDARCEFLFTNMFERGEQPNENEEGPQ